VPVLLQKFASMEQQIASLEQLLEIHTDSTVITAATAVCTHQLLRPPTDTASSCRLAHVTLPFDVARALEDNPLVQQIQARLRELEGKLRELGGRVGGVSAANIDGSVVEAETAVRTSVGAEVAELKRQLGLMAAAVERGAEERARAAINTAAEARFAQAYEKAQEKIREGWVIAQQLSREAAKQNKLVEKAAEHNHVAAGMRWQRNNM
jgi:hypothetical protein